MSLETRAKFILMRSRNFCYSKILSHLEEEGIRVSKVSLYLLFKKYEETQSIEHLKRRPRQQRLAKYHYRFIDDIMAENNDYTSRQLHSALMSQHPDLHDISVSTIKRARVSLGWISKKTRYCALISNCNQEKRVKFCNMLTTNKELEFLDVIWTNECSVQLESHRKITYHNHQECVPEQSIPTKSICEEGYPSGEQQRPSSSQES